MQTDLIDIICEKAWEHIARRLPIDSEEGNSSEPQRASTADVELLISTARERLATELDSEYLELCKRMDGASLGDITIFSARPVPGRWIVTRNVSFKSGEGFGSDFIDRVVYAEGEDSFYLHNLLSNRFERMPKDDRKYVLWYCESFAEMLWEALRPVLHLNDRAIVVWPNSARGLKGG